MVPRLLCPGYRAAVTKDASPWGLLATACIVTGLVVVIGYTVSSGSDPGRAPGSATTLAPQTATPAAAQSVLPAAQLTDRAVVAKAVTIHPKPKAKPRKKHRPAPASLDFVISSFNVLGDSHTGRGGTHARYAPGRTRIRWAADLLSQRGVDVVGLQEFQVPQLREFQQVAGGTYDVYPGSSLGSAGAENSIAWRRDIWDRLKAWTVSIPYFNGRPRPMPVVLLQSRTTGLRAYFANFHNPADTGQYRHQQRFRDRATDLQIGLVHQLLADGYPVFVTGDMNEREEYFCRMTASTPAVAANGGSNDGPCQPPHPMDIDWIFGAGNVAFSNYLADRGPLVRRTTDHYVVSASVRITK
jgi:endonuclease/exonuclease/phosphatase family metal-dependent hydrolase